MRKESREIFVCCGPSNSKKCKHNVISKLLESRHTLYDNDHGSDYTNNLSNLKGR